METDAVETEFPVYHIVVYALAFFVPLLLASPQYITGTIINCLLFIAADKLPHKARIMICVLPSLGAISHGVLFGPHTLFLVYFLPCIWIGNAMLMHLYRTFGAHSIPARTSIAAIGKYVFLQVFARIFVYAGVVPSVFLASMGYIQLATALVGGIMAYGIRRYTTH